MPTGDAGFDVEFEHLYRGHHDWLQRWIQRRLNCADLAAELAQDVFLRLVQHRTTALREPKAYLSSVARSLIVDLFRRRSLEQAYAESLALRAEWADVSVEARHQIIDTLFAIDRLLDELGERPRQIFLLAQLDGLSLAAIGRQLGLSTNTVRKHFIRAMAHCLALMDD